MAWTNRRARLAVAVVAALLAALAVAIVLVFPRQPMCEYNDYTVELRRLPTGEVPSRFVDLTPEDLEAQPLIRQILDAYADPSAMPGARFEGDFLRVPLVRPPQNDTARRANDFLVSRFGGAPYPVVVTSGDGAYYEWWFLVADPGPLGPCP